MENFICPNCKQVHTEIIDGKCPGCGGKTFQDFKNSDEYLRTKVDSVLEERKKYGLEGLVGGLAYVIINTEPDKLKATVEEFLTFTSLEITDAFEDTCFRTIVLKTSGSADFLIRSRKNENPFAELNKFPKARHLPNTRLETLVFRTNDIKQYVSIQKKREIFLLTDDIVENENFSFIQTPASKYTGNSIGFIQWHNNGKYTSEQSHPLEWTFNKTENPALINIKHLDHAATRVKAQDRDAAIIEFMNLTNYNFDFAIYVKVFNSITNVARLSAKDFAMVFTSGISGYIDAQKSGPTEKFVHNYGPRIHHLAFWTENIEDTFSILKQSGMDFLIDLVGSESEGLKQTFSSPSENTMLVNEYIHRYGDFDGFFTKSNVTLLTGATNKQ